MRYSFRVTDGSQQRRNCGLIVAAVFAVGITATEVADACTTLLPPAALEGYPAEGAKDVPIDVVPFYDGLSVHLTQAGVDASDAVQLRDSSGAAVPIVVTQSFTWTVTLAPEHELLPNARYRVELTLPARPNVEPVFEVLEFETGAERAAAPEPPAGAFLQHYELLDYRSAGCVSNWQRGTCVAFPPGLVIVSTFTDDLGQEGLGGSYLWTEPAFVDLTGINQGTPFRCVNLRSRAPNGVLSAATQLCREDAPFFDIDGSDGAACTSDGISFEGRLVTESADDPDPTPSGAAGAASADDAEPTPMSRTDSAGGGCSIALGRRSANGPAPWLALLAAAALHGVRRRRLGRRGVAP